MGATLPVLYCSCAVHHKSSGDNSDYFADLCAHIIHTKFSVSPAVCYMMRDRTCIGGYISGGDKLLSSSPPLRSFFTTICSFRCRSFLETERKNPPLPPPDQSHFVGRASDTVYLTFYRGAVTENVRVPIHSVDIR